MSHYRYLIIGGGMTADAAVRGIREVDPQGTIGLVSDEPDPPYDRPPLSKGLWKGKAVERIWRKTEARGVELHLGCRVIALDAEKKTASDNQGGTHSFERLLLATGGAPRRLPFEAEPVIYFRTLGDYRRLRNLVEQGGRFCVLGGGFIGSEIAAALAINGKEVLMVVPEAAIGSRMFPAGMGRFLNSFYQQKGVEILAEELVIEMESRGDRVALKTRSARTSAEQEFLVDAVVAGIGIQPNVDLARGAGLKVENGIVVDGFLRTSHPGIYAAGDVASFYNPALGMRMRVEHEDNANTMGKHAGRALAGEAIPYTHLPFFYSDMFDLGYEAVGEIDPRLEVVEDWKELFRQGVLYYLSAGRVRGVLLWNVWGQVEAARQLIAEPGPFTAESVKGRLPLPASG